MYKCYKSYCKQLKKLIKSAIIVQTIVRSVSDNQNIFGYGGKFYENENPNKTKGKTNVIIAPHSNASDFNNGSRHFNSKCGNKKQFILLRMATQLVGQRYVLIVGQKTLMVQQPRMQIGLELK